MLRIATRYFSNFSLHLIRYINWLFCTLWSKLFHAVLVLPLFIYFAVRTNDFIPDIELSTLRMTGSFSGAWFHVCQLKMAFSTGFISAMVITVLKWALIHRTDCFQQMQPSNSDFSEIVYMDFRVWQYSDMNAHTPFLICIEIYIKSRTVLVLKQYVLS